VASSELDTVPGIGPTRRQALLRRFGSVAAIRRASLEELAAVPGLSRTLATTVHQHLAGDDRRAVPTAGGAADPVQEATA
jgi:excinuclease ABC subunit C